MEGSGNADEKSSLQTEQEATEAEGQTLLGEDAVLVSASWSPVQGEGTAASPHVPDTQSYTLDEDGFPDLEAAGVDGEDGGTGLLELGGGGAAGSDEEDGNDKDWGLEDDIEVCPLPQAH
jgi:hypothetical protein